MRATFRLSSPEQQAFSDSIRRFAQRELADGALERAHSQDYPWEIAAKLAHQGLLGITIKEEDGGIGGTLMDAVIAIQELALVCPKSADVVQAGNFGAIRTFAEYASPELKERYLPDLIAGKSLLALGMSEPGAGSAVTELKTSAIEDGDHFIINGSKVFSTHSPHANTFLIYVRFGPGLNGIGSVIVERGTPGFEVGQPSPFMSGEEWCQLYFADCRIPKANVLLGPGGFKKQISGFNVERIGNSSRSLALGRHAFNVAREHCLIVLPSIRISPWTRFPVIPSMLSTVAPRIIVRADGEAGACTMFRTYSVIFSSSFEGRYGKKWTVSRQC